MYVCTKEHSKYPGAVNLHNFIAFTATADYTVHASTMQCVHVVHVRTMQRNRFIDTIDVTEEGKLVFS